MTSLPLLRGATRRPVPGAARRRALRIVGYAALAFFALLFLYPFVIQLANSFKTEAGAAGDPLSPWPHPFSDTGFLRVFRGTDFPLWLGNSVLVTVLAGYATDPPRRSGPPPRCWGRPARTTAS